MNTIAIDCGASFVKGALFSGNNVIKKIQRPTPAVHKGNDICKIEFVNLLVNQVADIVKELSLGEKEVNLCISNEMHGFILTTENGTPFTDYISWQLELGSIAIDGESCYDIINNSSELKEPIVSTGMPLKACLPSCGLLYLFRKRILDSNQKYRFYTLGSYLLKSISNIEPYEHPTNAAATGLYNLIIQDWDKTYIDYLGASNIVFPKVGNNIISFSSKGVLYNAFPALGDQQAALLGAGLTNENELSFNLGTGAQVSVLTNKLEFMDMYQIRPYFYGYYLKTIPHVPSGRAINVYFRFIKSVVSEFSLDVSDEKIWEVIFDSVSNSINPTMKIDLSFFDNAISNNKKGSINEISEWDFTINNLFGSIFKQLTSNYLDVSNRLVMNKDSINKIVFSGGISRKFVFITNEIGSNYPTAEVIVSNDETLKGLYIYSTM